MFTWTDIGSIYTHIPPVTMPLVVATSRLFEHVMLSYVCHAVSSGCVFVATLRSDVHSAGDFQSIAEHDKSQPVSQWHYGQGCT